MIEMGDCKSKSHSEETDHKDSVYFHPAEKLGLHHHVIDQIWLAQGSISLCLHSTIKDVALLALSFHSHTSKHLCNR